MAWLAIGCGDGDGPSAAPRRAVVTLARSAAGAMTARGDTRTIAAAVRDDGVVDPSPSVAWTSSAPGVATVTGTGPSATITAVDDGTTLITATRVTTTRGSARDTMTVTVRRALASVVLAAPAGSLAIGASMQLTATAYDARQQPIGGLTGFLFASSDPGRIGVSPTGVATALAASAAATPSTVAVAVTRDGVTAVGVVVIAVH